VFLYINDILGSSLTPFVANYTINATCNGQNLTQHLGHFVATACATALTVINTFTGAVLYQQSFVPQQLLQVITLQRFTFATIYFNRTMPYSNDTSINLKFNIT
jgi:hypothetical protein